MTKLVDAIESENLGQIESIVYVEGVMVDAPLESKKNTPLAYAAIRGKYESCKFLLTVCQASVSAKNVFGRT